MSRTPFLFDLARNDYSQKIKDILTLESEITDAVLYYLYKIPEKFISKDYLVLIRRNDNYYGPSFIITFTAQNNTMMKSGNLKRIENGSRLIDIFGEEERVSDSLLIYAGDDNNANEGYALNKNKYNSIVNHYMYILIIHCMHLIWTENRFFDKCLLRVIFKFLGPVL